MKYVADLEYQPTFQLAQKYNQPSIHNSGIAIHNIKYLENVVTILLAL